MLTHDKPLGILRPLGGGDPIPLKKEELIIGRRATSDIRLDFENVSGRHCMLRFVKGIWHVRDLGSTNGTTVNTRKLAHEQGVLPDDQIGIASHYFHIDYEPAGALSALGSQALAEDEEIVEQKKQRSLMELAGLAGDTDRAVPPSQRARPGRPPERIARPSAEAAEFEDAIPSDFREPAAPRATSANDDDFLKLIDEDVRKARKGKPKP
jgi:pSer/pThr/pTyr-binding forkhead associated (FHA) protein